MKTLSFITLKGIVLFSALCILFYALPVVPAIVYCVLRDRMSASIGWLIVTPLSLYTILEWIKDRQGFNIMFAFCFSGLVPTVFTIASAHADLSDYYWPAIIISAVATFLIWRLFPKAKLTRLT